MSLLPVFPARAGMSRRGKLEVRPEHRVPRASGDEPANAVLYRDDYKCSPRERG